MKELDFIKAISQEIGDEFIGDDCAYIKDLGIVISQDSLVENIHFRRDWYSPFQLGYKSAAVNISDILASGAMPAYMSIALSLTNDIDENFIREFYRGAKSVSKNIKITGGDITGSKQGLMISITVIGKTTGRNISSRKNAVPGYAIITKGMHGSSAAGLNELLTGGNNKSLILSHISPVLEFDFSKEISENVKEKYAMMDSSDGLADALFKIAEAGNVTAEIDYNSVPHLDCVTKEQVLYGGEDYKLVACVPENALQKINNYVKIGKIKEFDGSRVRINDFVINDYDSIKSFNHFSD